MTETIAPKVAHFEVNGEQVQGFPEPRTSLADFLRDDLNLTGTHLGCEHGVCGACSVEVDGQMVRSCITLAQACTGSRIRTIEGYDDDPVMAALREAFMDHHGLQCGFCTPGMLIACRDMVIRHEHLDEKAIRVALGGNLCRCTGYVGIVGAVMSVFERRSELLDDSAGNSVAPALEQMTSQPLPTFKRTSGQVDQVATSAGGEDSDGDQTLREQVVVAKPVEEVWQFLRDVEKVVPCVPGASILSVDGEDLAIEMEISLGAIRVRFQGSGRFTFDDSNRTGRFEGKGRDVRSGSDATGVMEFSVVPGDNENQCRINILASYTITGALSQFSRGGLVKSFVGAIARMFADNVQKVLSGGEASAGSTPNLSVFQLLLTVAKGWFRALIGRK
ncbi:MAG: 2Fe-2S iron-sulfur cluster binding domain-containing protein [Saccharospirillum sp.]|nr:2Fe-2S iron-sulfur cluster binding domain-containing protein [Saccharospirillum sp.]